MKIMCSVNLKNKWEVKATAVYYTIVDEEGVLITFIGLSGKDREVAQHICDLHNSSLGDLNVGLFESDNN